MASHDTCNFVKLHYRWSKILTDSMLRVSRSIGSDVDSLLSTLSMKSKCMNASRRTAFDFVKFRAVRARQVSGIFWSWKTKLSRFNEQYRHSTLSEKNVIPSFVSPAASLKTIPCLVESQRTIFERVRRVEWSPNASSEFVLYILLEHRSFMVHRTKYSNLMCSRCVYCNYMSVVRAFK